MEKVAIELVNLPWATLLTLACGYTAFYIANAGLREHVKPTDVVLATLVFGFLANFAYQSFLSFNISNTFASALAYVFSIFLGIVWYKFGRKLLIKSLRFMSISYSDETPSAWKALFSQTSTKATQLHVLLKDGTWLKSEELERFRHLPNGPCTFGDTGDVLMYVTHFKAAGTEDFVEISSVIDKEWGAEITYVPKENVAQIDFRRQSN